MIVNGVDDDDWRWTPETEMHGANDGTEPIYLATGGAIW